MNKKIIYPILSLLILASLTVLPIFVFAQAAPPQQTSQVCVFIKNIKDALILIGGTIVIIGWVIAGILWLVSAGNTTKTGTAKSATTAAVIGTILIVLSTVALTVIQGLLGQGSTGTCG